jgi:tRNA(Ile)-lysidine synthase
MNPANNFTAFLKTYDILNAPLIIAVSGGRDSMCLLHLCLSYQLNIVAAHCNFGLRDEESNDDEAFVVEYCKANNITIETIRFDTKKESELSGLSVQETARTLRYKWFEELRLKHGGEYILTAHHANDSIETLIHNMARGAGLKGMLGIPAKNGRILRPLSSCLVEDIKTYANVNGIPWREDSSNAKEHYTRNYIRHQVVPGLIHINSNAEAHLLQSMSFLKEADAIVHDYAISVMHRFTYRSDHVFRIKISELNTLSYARTLLFLWLEPYGFSTFVIDEIIKCKTTGASWFGKGFCAVYNRGELDIIPAPDDAVYATQFINTFPASVKFGMHSYLIKQSKGLPDRFEAGTLYLDASLIRLPLTVRQWKQGDVFIPLGMENNKKLSDFFTDLKLGMNEKKECVIIESASEIVAVAPYRINNKYRVSGSSSEVITVTLKD